MAKLNPVTRNRGTIQTNQGKVDYLIKKAFKGALNYTVYIDGEAKFSDLEMTGAKSKLEEYVKYWK